MLSPSKIIGIGSNYRRHIEEMGRSIPAQPKIFLMPPTALIGPGEAIEIPPGTARVDHEAELGVVIADLRVNGKSHGPHPFFLRLRGDDMKLRDGIRVEDMGTKTVANDLDNARVWFDSVRLPKDALLNKFAEIDDNDEYRQVGDERM